MRLRLPLPREDLFFQLLRAGGELVLEAAEAFVQLLEHYDEREARVEALHDIEERGDHVRHDMMRNLHRTFVTPIDREDIAQLSEHIDDVIDAIEEASRLLMEYDVRQPTKQIKELAHIVLDSAKELRQATDLLRFKGAKLQQMLPHCIEINRLENAADRATNRAIADLFQHQELPINILKLREIYAMLEHTTDLCEDAANVLEGIVLKHA